MRRREFITLFGTVATWSTLSLGMPTLAREPPKIIILHSGFPNRTPIHHLFERLPNSATRMAAQRQSISWAEKEIPIG
jgi:hypothetical protein